MYSTLHNEEVVVKATNNNSFNIGNLELKLKNCRNKETGIFTLTQLLYHETGEINPE